VEGGAKGSRPTRVDIGRIVKPHGLKGELVVSGVRLTAEEFAQVGEVHAVAADGTRRALKLRAVRPFQQSLLVLFDGVADVDAARALHGQVLEVDTERLPETEDGTVYLFKLVGLSVRTEEGEDLGRVADVFQTGATPILVVRGREAGDGGRDRERMLPMSPDVLVRVDTAGGEITVRLLPGMESL
jgi:16S rRNA processing protein RimM